MPPERRLWDSSVVLGYLAGDQRVYPVCPQIIEQAEPREYRNFGISVGEI